MKVPHSVTGRTSPSGQGLSYLRDVSTPRAFGAGVAQSLGQLGADVAALGARTQERNERTERFAALRSFSDWETDVAEQLTNLKREADPGTTNFVDQADSVFTSAENEFIQKQVPPALQEEFRFRTSQVKQRIIADALEFQYTQQDAFYRTELDKEYTKAKVGVSGDVEQMQAWSNRLADAILATDLPDQDKSDLARQMQAGLAAIVYGKRVEDITRQTTLASPQAFRDAIASIESEGSGDYGAVGPETGGDRAYGRYQVMGNNVPSWTLEALGISMTPEEFLKDPAAQDAVFDYKFAQFAARTGDVRDAASIWFTGRPLAEGADAEDVLGTSGSEYVAKFVKALDKEGMFAELDQEPLYENLPFEDRQAIKEDAARKVNSEAEEAEKARQAELDAARNSLYTSLHDGTAGQADILSGRKAGLLTDIDDIEKAEKLLEERDKDQEDRLRIQSMLDNPAIVYNPVTDAGAFDKWVGEEGRAAIGARNQDYLNGSILPAITQLKDVPPDLVGQLIGMTRSADNANVEFGYGALASIENVAPEAFVKRTTEDLAQKVDAYRALRNTANQEELMSALRGGRTPQEVQAHRTLLDEGRKLVREGKVKNPITADKGWFWFDASPGNWPAAQVEMEREWEETFASNFAIVRDTTVAKNMTKAQMDRVWATTSIGGIGTYAMRNPIELVYPQLEEPGYIIGTGYDGYEDQVRADLGLSDEENFQLVSDEQTRAEVEQYQRGQLDRLPSYSIVKFTADQRPIPLTDRWYGVPNAVTE